MFISNVEDFGHCVKKARKASKLTQAELAAVSNTGVRFIREIEKGKPSCQIAKAFYVAQIFGIKIHLDDPNNVK